MLGLADEVGRDEGRIGRGIGEDDDLGRPGHGVDAHVRAYERLRRGDVGVAGAGDEVDRFEHLGVVEAVGQRPDRLRSAHRPHLVDAEHVGGGEDHRVREAVGLGRAGDRQRLGTCGLRGDDVHDDRRRVDGESAGDIEADAFDGQVAGGHLGSGTEFGPDVGGHLVGGDAAGALDRLLKRGPDLGVEVGRRLRERLGGHPRVSGRTPSKRSVRSATTLEPPTATESRSSATRRSTSAWVSAARGSRRRRNRRLRVSPRKSRMFTRPF